MRLGSLLSPTRALAREWLGSTFEFRQDFRDLALDGRHWRAQFGGSSGPGPKMGGYVCCGPMLYVLFRLTMFSSVAGIVAVEIAKGRIDSYWFLYVEHLTLCVACIYFALAFLLTAFAVAAGGQEARSTPLLVLLCWVCYGVLLPASLACALMWLFVTQRNGQWLASADQPESADILPTVGVFGLVYLDLWVNRQPYYGSFHGFCGIIFCWGYLIFNLLYVLAFDGGDENGNDFVYRQLDWHKYMTAGKLLMIEFFVLLPYFNAFYWAVVWARRRARVAAKHNVV